MTFSWDLNTATLSLIAAQIVCFIIYLVKTNGKANDAYKLAASAKKLAQEAHAAIVLTNANISLLREKVAGDYPDHDSIASMEQRLVTEIHRGDGNLIEEIHRLSDRLDLVLDRRPQK